jgi:hypothetical protein
MGPNGLLNQLTNLGSAAEVMAWYTVIGVDLGICVYNRLSRVLLGG